MRSISYQSKRCGTSLHTLPHAQRAHSAAPAACSPGTRTLPIIEYSGSDTMLFVLAEEPYKSAIGDPGVRRDGLRVAIEAWNQCNEVVEEAPNMGSPRMADCFDIIHSSPIKLVHKVNEEDNRLGVSNALFKRSSTMNVNQYAPWKEIYLGKKCQVEDQPRLWQFWMIMLKSGNMDTQVAVCPENGKKDRTLFTTA
ncbi:hypothetical protein ACSBR2_008263 [Camellia fascicularis]